MIQTLNEIEKWYKTKDPWQYENSKDDLLRKDILLSELPSQKYSNVLDVGCGHGFITRDLPGKKIIGADISAEAIKQAKQYENEKTTFLTASIFELNYILSEAFDLIIITGVLYKQYVGNSLPLIYLIIDQLLGNNGILVSVHINSWYTARFPYLLLSEYYYDYRTYIHRLEIYEK
jgi:2-polyprenyl-3-methyl-5-hydroxy-6-metoxy-1,4-benzoquinol methylase